MFFLKHLSWIVSGIALDFSLELPVENSSEVIPKIPQEKLSPVSSEIPP